MNTTEETQPIYKVYEVQDGDTIVKIGTSVGMTADQVRDFHNTHCEKAGLMWLSGLVGINRILIPRSYKSPETIQLERNLALPKPQFFQEFYASSYHIQESFHSPESEDLIIGYDVHLEVKVEDEKNIMELTKNNFLKNNVAPDDKMSDISLACAQSIEPVRLVMNAQGIPVELQNHEQLVADFEKQLPDLEEFYTGEVYKKYLDKFAESISDKDVLLKKLKATFLYQTLFPNMKWFDKKNSWEEDFFVLQNSFCVKCLFDSEYNLDKRDEAETIIRAEYTEKYSLQEILKGVKYEEESDHPAQIEVKITYQTDKMSKKMEQANAELLFWYDGELYREHRISILKT